MQSVPAIGYQLPPLTAVAEGAAAQPDKERTRLLGKIKAATSPEEFRIIDDELTAQLAQRQPA